MNIKHFVTNSNNESYELIEVNKDDKASLNLYSHIDWSQRICELFKAIVFSLPIVTIACLSVRESWSSFWNGYQIQSLTDISKDQVLPHRWDTLQKIHTQKELILQGKSWEDILKDCPEAFEFAPLSVKSNNKHITQAVLGCPAMVCHISKPLGNDIGFLKHLAQICPKITLYLTDKKIKEQIFDSLSDPVKTKFNRDDQTGLSEFEKEEINSLIVKHKDVWVAEAKKSKSGSIYLKSKMIHSPCALQVFEDGTIRVHTKHIIACGTAKKIRAVYQWNSKEQFVKATLLKKNREYGALTGGDLIQDEIKIYNQLKDKRGISPLEDCLTYESKSASTGMKSALIMKRYTQSLGEQKKWTEEDLKVITLDLLYSIKALREADLYEDDFNLNNVLVLCDEKGKVEKACMIDFEKTKTLSNAKKLFKEEREAVYEHQNAVISAIEKLYKNSNVKMPQSLNNAKFQPKSTIVHNNTSYDVPEIIPPPIDELIQKFENEAVVVKN